MLIAAAVNPEVALRHISGFLFVVPLILRVKTLNNLDKSPDRIRGMFDRIAPRYDFLNRFLSFGIDISWRNRTIREVLKRTKIDKPVLDICCGTADLSLSWYDRLLRDSRYEKTDRNRTWSFSEISDDPFLSKQEPFSCEPMIIGLDFSPEMLAIGKRKIARKKADSDIRLLEGDATALPFRDNVFSAVSIGFGLRNLCDHVRGIEEMYRVCEPGGTVAILEFTSPSAPVISGLYSIYVSKLLPMIGTVFSRKSDGAYTYLPESVRDFEKGETLAEKMRAIGFEDVRYIPLTFGAVSIYLGNRNT